MTAPLEAHPQPDYGIAPDITASNESRGLQEYLAAHDWRGPSEDENVLIHRANRNETLTPAEMAIVSIVKSSSHTIDAPRALLLDFLKQEEMLAKLEVQIQDPHERKAIAGDPLALLRQENPLLHQASMQARRNVGIQGVPALTGIDLAGLVRKVN